MSKRIIIEIRNPLVNSEYKFITALNVLQKATRIKAEIEHNHETSEPTPYKVLDTLAKDIFNSVSTELIALFEDILKTWLRTKVEKARSPRLKLNGKVYINPKTGKYLTEKEWKIIQDDLTKIFSDLYGRSKEAIIKKAMALGKILQSMEPEDRLDADIDEDDFKNAIKEISHDDLYKQIINFANVHTGELIQDVTDRSRKGIVNVIMQGYQDGITNKQLEKNLFEQFDVLNRDWRRIAETETATNFNNGYLVGELKANEEKPVFMQGISGAGACDFCASHVNNQIVVLLPGPPKEGGETTTVNGKEYVAIWPGKNNFGRKRKQWWVASGTQHPSCRCNWVNLGDVNNEYIMKLREAMES